MLLRPIARPLFATWFVAEGVDAVRHPAEHVRTFRVGLAGLAARVPGDQQAVRQLQSMSDARLAVVVRAHGAAVALTGLALAAGVAPRTSAAALAALQVPLVVANLPAPRSTPTTADERSERRARLVRSVAFGGGALLAAADTQGRPGVAWRLQHERERRAAARASS